MTLPGNRVTPRPDREKFSADGACSVRTATWGWKPARSQAASRMSCRPLGVGQARSGMGKGDASGGAEPHPSGQTLKQWPAELTFQGLDLMGKAGLAHVQPGGRRRERTVIDDSDEVLELA